MAQFLRARTRLRLCIHGKNFLENLQKTVAFCLSCPIILLDEPDGPDDEKRR